VHFDADFADLFEVRGLRRRRRGTKFPVRGGDRSLALSYLGLDDVVRETLVTFDDPPESLKQGCARFRLRLEPGEEAAIGYDVTVCATRASAPEGAGDGASCRGACTRWRLRRTRGRRTGGRTPRPGDIEAAAWTGACERPAEPQPEPQARFATLRHEHERWDSGATDIFTDNEEVNRVLQRGQRDLRVLSAQIGDTRIPFSGLPWFAAPFGPRARLRRSRDPAVDLRWSRGAVDFLQARQGRQDSVFRDEQPGKILHEMRRGDWPT